MEREKSTTKITVPDKNLIQNYGEIKSFSDKQKLKEFSTTKPALQQMLTDLYSQEIQEKKKDLQNHPQTVRKWQ